MKLALISSVAVAAALFAVPAFAQTTVPPSNYVQLNVGAGFAGRANIDATIPGVGSGSEDVDLDTGLFLSASAGHAFGNGLAVEIEGIYNHNNLDSDDVSAALDTNSDASTRTWGGFVNAKYQIPTGWRHVSPYVGGGVGYGDVRIKIDGEGHDNDQGFMWQAKAGLAFPMNDRMTWDLGYRYLDLPNYSKSGEAYGYAGQLEVDSHVHVVSLGARMTF